MDLVKIGLSTLTSIVLIVLGSILFAQCTHVAFGH